jgi:hypothetical protein
VIRLSNVLARPSTESPRAAMSCASFFAAIVARLISLVATSFAFSVDFLMALSIER